MALTLMDYLKSGITGRPANDPMTPALPYKPSATVAARPAEDDEPTALKKYQDAGKEAVRIREQTNDPAKRKAADDAATAANQNYIKAMNRAAAEKKKK